MPRRHGRDPWEAMANLREAVELYLEPVEDDLAGRSEVEIQELVV